MRTEKQSERALADRYNAQAHSMAEKAIQLQEALRSQTAEVVELKRKVREYEEWAEAEEEEHEGEGEEDWSALAAQGYQSFPCGIQLNNGRIHLSWPPSRSPLR